MFSGIRAQLLESRDAASLAVYRILLGTLLCLSSLRFLWNGWVGVFYGQPTFFFKYWGFEWVEVLPLPWMTAAYVVMSVLALFVALGFFYRISIVAFFLIFTYVELVDVTNYLNHYYLVSLLTLLMCFVPANRVYSIDALLRPKNAAAATVPAWMLYLMRFQVGTVYVFAGLAKLQPDWLLHAQPLGIWLAARTETPLLGPLFELSFMPYLMSWAGFLFDTFIVAFLLWRKSRPYAFALVLLFHSCTHLLFVIGIFPFLMVINATLFFEPEWPRVLGRRLAGLPRPSRLRASADTGSSRWSSSLAAVVAIYCVLQVLVPLRAFAYPGDVLWHEQGMRYSWRVMVREKNGSIVYRVRWQGRERDMHVPPSKYLTSHQEREMSGQPDLILQLAHHIADDFESRGYEGVEVRVNALVSLNGRRSSPVIDPDIDLAKEGDTLSIARWIAPRPPSHPLPVRRLSAQADLAIDVADSER